ASSDVVEQQTSRLPVWTTGETASPGHYNCQPSPVTLSIPLPAVAEDQVRGPYPISILAMEQQVHERINQQRIKYGLGSLVSILPLLILHESIAKIWLPYTFSHTNPAGQNPTARGVAGDTCTKNYGSYYAYGIAENLFQNNLHSAADVLQQPRDQVLLNTMEEIAQVFTSVAAMNSSGHQENILTLTFDREGIGIAIAPEKVYNRISC
ncbi:MAG: hypothetical protein M0C28_47275, partial [Candidatus Moduliflexus flocculans]|nr:hypothetical protein [Candidatus Moduliflexus flocculans]